MPKTMSKSLGKGKGKKVPQAVGGGDKKIGVATAKRMKTKLDALKSKKPK